MPATPALFLHGAGRAGRAAWPHQHALEGERPCLWLPRVAPGDPPDRVVALARDLVDRPAHVVAHSYGGLAALRLAERHPALVRSLTLVELAALALSADAPHTRAHVATMGPVLARADDPATDDREFSRLFAAAMGVPVPDLPPDELASVTRQLRATAPPWTQAVDASVPWRVPTLVVVGGLGTMYDEVSAVLAAHGAERAVLDGAGRRPHDDERFAGLLSGFWATVDS